MTIFKGILIMLIIFLVIIFGIVGAISLCNGMMNVGILCMVFILAVLAMYCIWGRDDKEDK